MPKFKCELVPGSYFTAVDMLNALSQQQLVAAALENTIVLAAEPAMAWLLDRCCVGRPIPDAPDASSSSLVARVAEAAGVNGANAEWQQQYEQYLIRMQSRRRRKARRMPGYHAAAAGAGMTMTNVAVAHDATTGGPEQLQPQGQAVPAETPADAYYATPGEVAMDAAAAQRATGHAARVQGSEVTQQGNGLLGPGPRSTETPALAADVNLHTAGNGAAAALAAAADSECYGAFTTMAVDGADLPSGAMDGSGYSVYDSSAWPMPLQLVQLSCHEAFFLTSVLQCCTVFCAQHPAVHQASDGKPHAAEQEQQLQSCYQQMQFQQELQVPELWQWCCAHAPGGADIFVSRYAAYKHFRSKGWLPLPGLLYGADYVLYKLHPEHAHSDFVVTVMIERPGWAVGMTAEPAAEAAEDQAVALQTCGVNSLNLQEGHDGLNSGSMGYSGNGSTRMTWLDAHIMQRLARQVLKQFLLLYVVMPSGLQLQTAECMQQLEVREVLVQRWVPSQHREDGREWQ